jgi:hypothetical protein
MDAPAVEEKCCVCCCTIVCCNVCVVKIDAPQQHEDRGHLFLKKSAELEFKTQFPVCHRKTRKILRRTKNARTAHGCEGWRMML